MNMSMIKKSAPLVILLFGLVAFLVFGLHRYVSFEVLQENRAALLSFAARHALWAPIALAVAYATFVAFSLPGATVMTIACGFIFGAVMGTVVAVVGATVGAVILFLAARSSLADVLRERAGSGFRKLEAGFCANALSYLLVLRLIPVFPFWMVNIVPALCGVPLRIFILGTLVGIIPGTFIYASIGSGLDAVLQAGGTPSFNMILQPDVLLPLFGLAFLALLPAVYKQIKRTH